MGAARDLGQLPPIFTNSAYAFDWKMFGVSLEDPESWDGASASLLLAPARTAMPAAGDVHELTTAGGGIVMPLTNVFGARMSNTDHEDWTPGLYVVQLRAARPAGDTETLYIGTVPVFRGLGQLATLGGGRQDLPNGEIGSVSILRPDASAARIIRGPGGSTGKSAKQYLIDAGLLPPNATDAEYVALVSAYYQAAESAAEQTALDRVATGQDRIATGQDRTATGQDRTQTGLDRTQTGLDRVQTGADRTQTGLDRTQTGADKIAADGSAAAAAASAATAASAAMNILERVALADPAATLAQDVGAVLRGVEFAAARSPGQSYFRNGLVSSSALTALATVTRGTAAWGIDQAGVVSSFAPGQPVATTAGVAVYEARTNSIRNPVMTGAAGGSPGTLPANWVVSGSSPASVGLTQTLATGTEDGRPYLEVSLAGTPSITGATGINFDGPGQVAALVGEVWTAACELRQIGAAAGVSNVTLAIIGRDAGGAGTGTLANSISLSNTRTAFTNQATLVGAATAFVQAGVGLGFTSGVPFSLTYRIYAPNLKKGADIKDPPILQATNAPATRNADVITEAVNIAVGQAFTVTGKVIAPSAGALAAAVCSVFTLDDGNSGGSYPNRLRLYVGAGPTASVIGASNGVAFLDDLTIAQTPGQPLGLSIAVVGNQLTWSINGLAVRVVSLPGGAFSVPLTRLTRGASQHGTLQLNSTLRDLPIVMRAYSNSEHQAASDVSLVLDLDFVTQTYRYAGSPYLAVTDLPMTTFTRATEALAQDANGQWRAYAPGVLAANSSGLNLAESTVNKCVGYNYNPADAAYVGVAGGAVATAIPRASLPAPVLAGLQARDPTGIIASVIKVVFDGSAVQVANCSGVVGNLNPHSVSSDVYIEAESGGGTTLRLSNNELPAGGPVALTTVGSWFRAKTENITPAFTSSALRFRCSAGCTATIYIALWQLEEKAYCTPPVKVAGASATRNQDGLAWAATLPAAYTLFVEFVMPSVNTGAGQVLLRYDDGTNSNVAQLRLGGNLDTFVLEVITGGAGQSSTTVSTAGVAAGSVVRMAARIAANDLALSVNGAAPVTDASAALPVITTGRVGTDTNGGADTFTRPIRKARRTNGGKTNAELQAMAA